MSDVRSARARLIVNYSVCLLLKAAKAANSLPRELNESYVRNGTRESRTKQIIRILKMRRNILIRLTYLLTAQAAPKLILTISYFLDKFPIANYVLFCQRVFPTSWCDLIKHLILKPSFLKMNFKICLLVMFFRSANAPVVTICSLRNVIRTNSALNLPAGIVIIWWKQPHEKRSDL